MARIESIGEVYFLTCALHKFGGGNAMRLTVLAVLIGTCALATCQSTTLAPAAPEIFVQNPMDTKSWMTCKTTKPDLSIPSFAPGDANSGCAQPMKWHSNELQLNSKDLFQTPPVDSKGQINFGKTFHWSLSTSGPNWPLVAQNVWPDPLPPAQWAGAGAIPIPTQWPNARVEQIPTEWPGLTMLPIAPQLTMQATSQKKLKQLK